MTRLIFSIILLLGAGAVFMFLVDPLVRDPLVVDQDDRVESGGIFSLLDQRAGLNEALDNADALNERINELQSQVASISAADHDRLETFIPAEDDPMSVLVDLDKIASDTGLKLHGTSYSVSDDEVAGLPAGISETRVSGSVTADYVELEEFLNRLAAMRRPLDVTELSFSVGTDSNTGLPETEYDVDFTVRTYQFRSN